MTTRCVLTATATSTRNPPGNTPPTKFLILTHPRSGSNLLRRTLNTHPAICSQGELFNAGLRGDKVKNTDSVLQRAFTCHDPAVQAIGFTLHYEQAVYKEINPLPKLLIPELRIIHLWRRNLLRRYLSKKVAMYTGTWVSLHRGNRAPRRIEITPEELDRDFSWVTEQSRIGRDLFRNHQSCDVFYEDLSDRFEETIDNCERFLGVDPLPAMPACEKLETRTLAESIKNYKELKSHFATTPWAVHFDE